MKLQVENNKLKFSAARKRKRNNITVIRYSKRSLQMQLKEWLCTLSPGRFKVIE
ncbi:MAG: hypothetical protein ACHQRM_10740 [Bacteroidia bacterium]